MESEAILQRAKTAWKDGERTYRDTQLAVGGIIHEYIAASLSESPGSGRHEPLNRVAKELDLSAETVRQMIRTAMVVRNLSDNGHVGELGIIAIRAFAAFVHRPDKKREAWEPVPGRDGAKLFREAVAKNIPGRAIWKFLDSQPELRNRPLEKDGRPRNERSENDPDAPPSAAKAIEIIKPMLCGSPRDAAGIILEMVADADDPGMIVLHLQRMIGERKK